MIIWVKIEDIARMHTRGIDQWRFIETPLGKRTYEDDIFPYFVKDKPWLRIKKKVESGKAFGEWTDFVIIYR